MTTIDVQYIRSQFPNTAMIYGADASYACVDEDWLLDVYHPWFVRICKRMKVWKYRANNDCDNFADLYRVLAGVCHAQSDEKKVPQGIAVLRVSYKRDVGGWHANNAVFVGLKRRIFIEPQTPGIVTLTEAEQANTRFVHF